ncbi:MAG: hypothetical protein HF309_19230 [Ignavibacteria bacterium]|jgi:vacuolar-type H+-ATPase subunit I/STV1|nr:hypothetical protein [Ignavibacteria bacterium]
MIELSALKETFFKEVLEKMAGECVNAIKEKFEAIQRCITIISESDKDKKRIENGLDRTDRMFPGKSDKEGAIRMSYAMMQAIDNKIEEVQKCMSEHEQAIPDIMQTYADRIEKLHQVLFPQEGK